MLFYWVMFIETFSFLDHFLQLIFLLICFECKLWGFVCLLFYFESFKSFKSLLFHSEVSFCLLVCVFCYFCLGRVRPGGGFLLGKKKKISIMAYLQFVLRIILCFCSCHNDIEIIQQKSRSLWKLLFSLCEIFKSSCKYMAASHFNVGQMRVEL